MKEICDHAGWGQYPGEDGACPPPAETVAIDGGRACPVCGSSLRSFSGPDALAHAVAGLRETAVMHHIERR